MNNKLAFKFFFITVIIGVLFASCDKDFNDIGTDVIGDNHFDFENITTSSVVAFNQATNIVQSNNLPVNSLGIYNNPVFGKTKANFVTQLSIDVANSNPTFDPAFFIAIDSVVLSVPYFSRKVSVTNSVGTYELDSIQGTSPINLKVFESGYFLTDLDPSTDFQESQLFYSDENNRFDAAKVGNLLNNSTNEKENVAFVPSVKEYVQYKRDNVLNFTEEVDKRLSPRMSLHLNKDFFLSKIINAPDGKLFNNDAFRKYFRGLYFQVADAEVGQLMNLDFTKGDVTVYYNEYAHENADGLSSTPETIVYFDHDKDETTPEIAQKILKTYIMTMTGNTVNLLEQTNNPNFSNAIANPNSIIGDEKLYLKGGAQGAMTIIDLFGRNEANKGVTAELEDIKNQGWLINDASLTFFIDQTSMIGAAEPQRIYLYDLTNKRPLYDYSTDGSKNVKYPILSKSVFGGILEKEEVTDGRGIQYKIRITNHIRNLIRNDSTNVRLGLVVTQSINEIRNVRLKTPISTEFVSLDRIPAASVMNPFGTILWGNTPNVPENKKLKLEIYYTKPN